MHTYSKINDLAQSNLTLHIMLRVLHDACTNENLKRVFANHCEHRKSCFVELQTYLKNMRSTVSLDDSKAAFLADLEEKQTTVLKTDLQIVTKSLFGHLRLAVVYSNFLQSDTYPTFFEKLLKNHRVALFNDIAEIKKFKETVTKLSE